MPSRAQQILVKRAQREAGLADADYREAIETVSGIPGCRSSTDGRLTDEHLDKLLAYFEAIFWRRVDLGELQPGCNSGAIFRQRHFWAQRNRAGNTSRDRHTAAVLSDEIGRLEAGLAALGFGPDYCAAIREKVAAGRAHTYGQRLYKAALERTLRAKQNALAGIAPATPSRG